MTISIFNNVWENKNSNLWHWPFKISTNINLGYNYNHLWIHIALYVFWCFFLIQFQYARMVCFWGEVISSLRLLRRWRGQSYPKPRSFEGFFFELNTTITSGLHGSKPGQSDSQKISSKKEQQQPAASLIFQEVHF